MIEPRTVYARDFRFDDQLQQQLTGYAVRFDTVSKLLRERDGTLHYEKVKRGAFKRSIEMAEVFACVMHKPETEFASMFDHSLRLEEHISGLWFGIEIKKTDAGLYALRSVREKRFTGVSIRFSPTKQSKEFYQGYPLNIIEEADLIEISLVDRPAHNNTVVTEQKSIVNIHESNELRKKRMELMNKF